MSQLHTLVSPLLPSIPVGAMGEEETVSMQDAVFEDKIIGSERVNIKLVYLVSHILVLHKSLFLSYQVLDKELGQTEPDVCNFNFNSRWIIYTIVNNENCKFTNGRIHVP